MTGSSIAVNIPVSGRLIAAACLILATFGVAAGIALAWPPLWNPKAGLTGLLPLLPAAAGLLSLLAGGICLLAASPATPLAAPEPTADLAPALRTILLDFNHLLMEERDRLNAMQQAFDSTTQEAMAATGRLSRLSAAAGDAEARLNAGIAQAEEALRQPAGTVAWAADAAQRVEQALPAMAELIRQCGHEQTQVAVAALEAAVVRIATETQGPLQTIHNTASETAGQIAALGETAAALRQDVAGLDTASRSIATASAMVVARVGEAVVNFESTLATLPSAVAEAATHAAQAITEAAVTLTADTAALDQSHQATMRIAHELRQAGDEMAERLGIAEQALTHTAHAAARHAAEAKEKVDAALDRLPAAAVQATQILTAFAATLRTDGDQWIQSAEDLRSAGRDLAADSTASVARALDVVAHVDAALRQLPADLTDAANQAARTLSEAAAVLCADSAALDASGRETMQAAQMLLTAGREASSGLVEAGQQMRDAGGLIAARSATAMDYLARLPAAAGGITSAADQAAQTLAEAAATLRAEGAGIGTTLTAATNGTLRAVDMLQAAGQNAAAIGAALERLPELTTGLMEAASEATRALTGGAAAVAQTVGSAASVVHQAVQDSERTHQQVTGLAERLDIATAALADRTYDLDAAGQRITAASGALLNRTDAAGAALDAASLFIGTQVARLSEVTGQAEAQASLLPAATAELTAAADRLTHMADAARAALPGEAERTHSVALLGSLSSDLHDAMRRFEAVLARQDGVFPAVFDAMTKVETAVADVRAALDRPTGASADHVVSGSAPPAALAATLQHLEGVTSRTDLLLRQTEALAEAVMHGRAPGLPLLLADRTPALLAEVDQTIRRLRSVATALALASDGPPRSLGAIG